MKLRIVGGRLSRRYITLASTAVKFRPTTERNRQAVAEVLKSRLADAVVGDFCAGSGAIGFELLSRGAGTVHFVESDRKCCQNIELHIKTFNAAQQCRVFCQDIKRFTSVMPCSYDIIYFDPPYEDTELAQLVSIILNGLTKDGLLLHERRKDSPGVPESAQIGFSLWQTREYGDSAIDIWARNQGT
jgi:16S rRNA (guanine966-N2)-methyltransferase